MDLGAGLALILEAQSYIGTLIIFYMIACIFFFLGRERYYARFWKSRELNMNPHDGILLVIAHPDDEVMFFGPTILNLVDKGYTSRLYLLCLSQGNYDGQGSVRKRELWKCCMRLGFRSSNIQLCKFDYLEDGPKKDWSPELVARVIKEHVIAHSIGTIITFDEHGVSGHKNHTALYHGVWQLVQDGKLPDGIKVYALETVNLYRKYCLWIFDILLSYSTSQFIYVIAMWQRRFITYGMQAHSSQYNWYRKLYLIFSRYTIINTLKLVQAPVKAKTD